MSFWDGTQWTTLSPPPAPKPRHPVRDWVATLLGLLVLGATLIASAGIGAVTPTLTLTPSGGIVGTAVNVNGANFLPGQRVRLTWDGSTSGMPVAIADASGGLQTAFRVPRDTPDAHRVDAIDARVGASPDRTRASGGRPALASVEFVLLDEAATDRPSAMSTSPTPAEVATSMPQPTAVPTAQPTAVPTGPVTPAPTIQATPLPTPTAGPTLTFAAEFTSGVDAFAYDGQWGAGFGSESDFMGDLRQVTVANGVATIVAERTPTPSGRTWASAIMSTRGRFAQQYGYFEARIRYSAGNGLWPAFWMNPADGSWPPEIDILEAYPNLTAWPGPTRIYSTLHYSSANLTHDVIHDAGIDLTGSWHTYGLDWRPGSLTFYLDGNITGQITQDVPSNPHYLILDLAVGNWSALPDLTTPNASTMQIDYVRVYR
jgi:beta-glucanase (GH16 family)